jgi:hypothetical protein
MIDTRDIECECVDDICWEALHIECMECLMSLSASYYCRRSTSEYDRYLYMDGSLHIYREKVDVERLPCDRMLLELVDQYWVSIFSDF